MWVRNRLLSEFTPSLSAEWGVGLPASVLFQQRVPQRKPAGGGGGALSPTLPSVSSHGPRLEPSRPRLPRLSAPSPTRTPGDTDLRKWRPWPWFTPSQ